MAYNLYDLASLLYKLSSHYPFTCSLFPSDGKSYCSFKMLGSFKYAFPLLEISQSSLLTPCKLPLSKLLPLTFHISSSVLSFVKAPSTFTSILTCSFFSTLLAIISLQFWNDPSGILVLHL